MGEVGRKIGNRGYKLGEWVLWRMDRGKEVGGWR